MLLQPLFLYLMTMNSVLVKHCHPATLNTMLICPKFWMSRMCRFYNTITPYSSFPFGFSSIIAGTIVLFLLLSQNACLLIFIAECSFPCAVMATGLLGWQANKHRLNKDWCHSYMSYCLSANAHMAIWLHILLFTDLLFLYLLFHSLWKLCNTKQTSAEWCSHVTGMPPTAKLQALFL